MSYTNEEIIVQLIDNAKLYSKYSEKYLVLLHTKSRKQLPPDKTVVYFGKENFMHLNGIRSSTYNAFEFFDSCLSGIIQTDNCTPAHSVSNRNAKIMVFKSLFDYSKSKLYKFAYKDLPTDKDDFLLATGTSSGTIGYDFRHSDNLIPTTLLNNSISYYCSDLQKILAVVQKCHLSDKEYDVIYEIKDGIFNLYGE